MGPDHVEKVRFREMRDRAKLFQNYWWLILLVLGIGVSGYLQLAAIAAGQTVTHDEAISFIAATGHKHAYRESMPAGQWAPASEWKQYWQPERLFDFGTISSGLARFDIHPPLYFWLLNIWTFIFGTSLHSSAALNVIFFVLTAPLVFLLARQVLQSSRHASALAFTWALSPSVIIISVEVRQYALLGLCAVLFVFFLLQCINPKASFLSLLALGLCTAAGLLTHYYFSLLIGAGLTLVLLRYIILRDSRAMVTAFASMVIGIGLFAALHPLVFGSARVANELQRFDAGQIVPRLEKTLKTFASFYVDASLMRFAGALLLTLVVWATFLQVRKRAQYPDIIKRIAGSRQFQVLYLLFVLSVAILLLYVLGMSQAHAMAAKYLAMVFPLLAFVPFVILPRLDRSASTVMAGLLLLCLWQLDYGVRITDYKINYAEAAQRTAYIPVVENTSCILLDSTQPGILPISLWHSPDGAYVYADAQGALLEDPENWLSGMPSECIYVASPTYGNTTERRDEILSLLKQHGFEVQNLDIQVVHAGSFFRITRQQERSHSFELPPITHPLHFQLGQQVELLGYDLVDEQAAPGGQIELTLYWRARGATDLAYKVFSHLGQPGFVPLAQDDREPGDGCCPTDTWVEGEIVVDRHVIALPADLTPDTYALMVGMYNDANGQRLPVFDAEGRELPDQQVLLAEVAVRP